MLFNRIRTKIPFSRYKASHKDIWICREGIERIVCSQLAVDHPGSISCVIKNQWVESTSHEQAKDCPWAHQRLKDCVEFKNQDTDRLVETIYKHAIEKIPADVHWEFHSLRVLFIFFFLLNFFFLFLEI